MFFILFVLHLQSFRVHILLSIFIIMLASIFYIYILPLVGRIAQSVATDYRLDGPGSNPGGDDIFRPSSVL